LAAIVASSDDAIISKDLDGVVTSWNPGAEQLFGYTAEEIIGKSIALQIPAHLQHEESRLHARLARGERIEHFETTRVRKDGAPVKVSLSVSPIKNEQGRVVGASTIARDITEREKAESALAHRTLQLALAERAALVGSYAYESDLETMNVSEGYCAMHGLPEGTTETTRNQWRARVHPGDVERIEEIRAGTFAEKRDVYHVEYRIVPAGGEVRWIESRSIVSYDGDAQPHRVIGINIDVTERRQTEARLYNALAAGQVVAFEWDAASGRSQRSGNADRVMGLVDGGNFVRQVHPDDRGKFKILMRELSFGNSSYAFTFRFVRPDGRQIWLEETAEGEFDSTGRLLCIKGLTRDISECKELEDHKNTLISELDHRVKNMLSTVSTVVSRTRESSSSMVEFVAALEGRIKSMAVTHERLSYRRWQGIPLAELVRHELAPFANGSNTHIAGPPVMLSAEAGQTLAMVFHELATNAAKDGAISTASGRVCVRWSFRRNGHAESWLCIEWEESGGPNVVQPTRSGFGTSVVRELIPYELGGHVDFVPLLEGIRAKLEIPAHWLST
jgi:PAS domain S-box-containing protein